MLVPVTLVLLCSAGALRAQFLNAHQMNKTDRDYSAFMCEEIQSRMLSKRNSPLVMASVMK
jgi:hypothetical protein